MQTIRRKVLVTVLLAALVATAMCASAQSGGVIVESTPICGNVTENTTWTLAGSPYVLTCNVYVTNGATLTIEPGVEVRGRYTCLATDNTGAIVANGTALQPILFTSDDGSAGSWAGVCLSGDASTPPASSFTYCTVEKAGGYPDYACLHLSSHNNVTVSHCTFTGSSSAGARVVGCSPNLDACIFSDNADHGIGLSSASPGLTGCTIATNGNYGVFSEGSGSNPQITGCTISGNTTNPVRLGLSSVISSDTTISGNGAIEHSGGTISASSRTWHKYGCPYRLLGDVTVTGGAQLTVDPGVQVRGYYGSLLVDRTSALIANGTSEQPVVFTADDGSSGGWAGICLDGQGGAPPASSLAYCTVEKAGGYPYYADLYLNYHDSVAISHCTFTGSSSAGARVVACSPNLDSCIFSDNADHGIDLYSGSPSLTGCTMATNGNYGIFSQSSGCNLRITGCTISNNAVSPVRMGINSIISADTTISGNGAIECWYGTISASNRTWHKYGCPYLLTGDVTVTEAILTIEPGVQVRSACGVLYIGTTSALIANGTTAQPITFTSNGGTPGEWGGIHFQGQGGTPPPSSLTYCIVEKGGGYPDYDNVCLYHHGNVTINNCTFRDSFSIGVQMIGCSPSLTSCAITNNAGHGIYLSDASPALTGCTVTGNHDFGVYSENNGCNSAITGCTITGNTTAPLRLGLGSVISADTTISGNGAMGYYGGTISGSSRTWHKHGCPYQTFGDITVAVGSTLTVEPGIQVRASYGGFYIDKTSSLVANGTSGQPITFTSDSGSPGVWKGICFDGQGGTPPASSLTHCTVEKGGEYPYYSNVYLNYHNSLTISNCTFSSSSWAGMKIIGCNPNLSSCVVTGNADHGLHLSAASPGLTGCTLATNGTYGIYSENNGCDPILTTCVISGNAGNPMRVGINTAISSDTTISGSGAIEYYGGTTNASNRTWRKYAPSYRILGDVIVRNRATLTVQAGVTVRFASSGLCIGQYLANDPTDRGILLASASQAEPITFTADSGTSGGWKGITFDGRFDTTAGRTPPSSTMTWCTVEKAGYYDAPNLVLHYHSKVTLQYCRILNGTADGLLLTASSPTASSSITGNRFAGNGGCGMRATSASSPGIADCHMENNGTYGINCEDTDSCPVIETSVIAGNGTAPMRLGFNSVFSGNAISGNGAIELHGGTTTAADRTWFKWAPAGRKYPGDYALLADVVVRNGATVTVEPGCVITGAGRLIVGQASSSYDPTQRGALIAVGTPSAPITFTSTNGQVGGWGSLYFDGRNDASPMACPLSYCVIEKGGHWGASTLEGVSHSAVTLSHCTVCRCNATAVALTQSNWNISDCVFARNNGYAIQAVSSTPTVATSDFWSNTSGNWSGFAPGAGCIQQDPRFLSLVDYHLQETSPCRGTGSGGTDMGAYPFGASSAVFDTYYAKTLPDGTEVELIGKTVAAGTEDFGDCAYIEETSRYSGLKVRKAVTFTAWEQDQVNVTGVMRTDGCERYMDALTVTYATTADNPIRPLFMANRTVGGVAAIAFTSGGGPAPGAQPGLSNVGLLIRTSGTVTQVDTANHWFFIDDGSGRMGTGENRGIKVSLANLATGNVITLPYVGARLAVTGISTIEGVEGETYSVIRPRTQNDIEHL